MTMKTIRSKVRYAIANVLGCSPREIEMPCDLMVDLGLDEMDLAEVYESLEDELDVLLDEKGTQSIDTVQDLVDVLEDQLLD